MTRNRYVLDFADWMRDIQRRLIAVERRRLVPESPAALDLTDRLEPGWVPRSGYVAPTLVEHPRGQLRLVGVVLTSADVADSQTPVPVLRLPDGAHPEMRVVTWTAVAPDGSAPVPAMVTVDQDGLVSVSVPGSHGFTDGEVWFVLDAGPWSPGSE